MNEKKEEKTLFGLNMREILIILIITLAASVFLLYIGFYYNPTDAGTKTNLTELDGQYITFAGYISPYSPSDGSFVFLTSDPYDGLPSDSTTKILGVFPARVHPPADMVIEYTPVPVAVTGKVKCLDGTYTDDYGVNCDWYLEDSTVTPLVTHLGSIDKLPEELQAYHNIASNGLCEAAYTALCAVDFDLHYSVYGGTTSDLQSYSVDSLLTALQFEEMIGTPECSELCTIIVDIGDCLHALNTCIESEDYDKLTEYEDDYLKAKKEFEDWCAKFRITDEILDRM